MNGEQHHLSWLYARFLEKSVGRDPRLESPPGENLRLFAAKHGYEPEEIAEVFQEELLQHDSKECIYPGCLEEFRREATAKKPKRPYRVGDAKKRRRLPLLEES